MTVAVSQVITRGSDVLAALGNFRLVGRDQELKELTSTLMKMRKNNLIVTGRGGVGISAIVLGFQALKNDTKTPVDIVGKRFFWLNSDKLIESGNAQTINSLFDRVRQTLLKSKDSVLVIEDTIDFIRGAQSLGCSNLLNALMGDLKASKYQAILEAKDDNLGEILKCDGDVLEVFTLYEVREPTAENLRLILTDAVQTLEQHHGIRIEASAIETAATLTEKYKLPELRAQPDAAFTLLDRTLTDAAREAHISPKHIAVLKDELKRSQEHGRAALVQNIADEEKKWEGRQNDVRRVYRDLSDGEEEIRKLEDTILQLREETLQSAKQVERSGQGGSNALSTLVKNVNAENPQIAELQRKIVKLESLVAESRSSYKSKVAEIYAGLAINGDSVLRSFSVLSGIPVDTLTEDERTRLRGLEDVIAKRVIGQPEPTLEVAKAVKRARLGLKLPNKPAGTFLCLGPSGVGKTELAKALAEALQVPLLRFDMSEYMEKHAAAKLIGAPPGYEGYEHGGVLTNAIRKCPYSVVLFDEIEKAHIDVFNIFLQVLDDARLTDSRGLTASFKDAVIIMTTNVGTPHFLDEALSFEEAKERALLDLRNQYRPEFLGRFRGNIYCFQRLGLPVLEQIARKDISRIGKLVEERGIRILMADEDLRSLIEAKYVAREGARSVLGYIDRYITSGLADVVLNNDNASGDITISFDPVAKLVRFQRTKAQAVA